jgi:cobalt/nickel transport system permease protein
VRQAVVGGLAGALGTVLAALILAGLLVTGGEDFFGVAKIALLVHVPVIVIEGLVSGFTIAFLARVKPEMLGAPFGQPAGSEGQEKIE